MFIKNIKLTILLFVLFFVQGTALYAYTISPTCPEMSDITASHVEAFYGYIQNPYQDTALVFNRHVVINTPGTDPNTGGLLQMLPLGKTAVVRLGNSNVGFEAEALRYHFIVDASKSILEVKFAVVFQDPNHPHSDQPRFRVRIMDKHGVLLGDCSEYDVTSSNNLDGFQTYDDGLNAPVRWRDWTSLILDLSRMVGDEVQVEFTTFDCNQGAHYGYAYFTADCMTNQMTMQACSGTEVTAEAPPGFASYLWDNGDRTPTSTRLLDGEDIPLSCTVVNEMGCWYTYNGLITDSVPVTSSAFIRDTICEGNSYLENYFNLPPQNEIGQFTYTNSYINSATCTADYTTTLQLEVRPQFYRFKDAICFGESYTQHGFNLSNPPLGLHKDTLIFPRPGNCDSLVCLELKVNKTFVSATGIIGDPIACVGEELVYTITDVDTTATYNWQVPPYCRIVAGQGTGYIYVVFEQATSGQIKVFGENGCGSVDLSLDVVANPSYHEIYTDSLCAGLAYNKYGFALPVQDSVGVFVHINKFQTSMGCDSVSILNLLVTPNVNVDIQLQKDSFICAGNSTTLNAVSASGSGSILMVPKVYIGDIQCSDGTFVEPSKFAASGKTAVGVVFYVDNSGEHGWVVKKTESPTTYAWSNNTIDLPGLYNYPPSAIDFLSDLDGYASTLTIRLSGSAASYPAAYAVDFANGWFLPTIGQMRILFNQYFVVNPILISIGGAVLTETQFYHTSTEYSGQYVYVYLNDASYHANFKSVLYHIREVRNF